MFHLVVKYANTLLGGVQPQPPSRRSRPDGPEVVPRRAGQVLHEPAAPSCSSAARDLPQVKMLTPPGPTSSPTTMSTAPQRSCFRRIATIPEMTRITARIHNSVTTKRPFIDLRCAPRLSNIPHRVRAGRRSGSRATSPRHGEAFAESHEIYMFATPEWTSDTRILRLPIGSPALKPAPVATAHRSTGSRRERAWARPMLREPPATRPSSGGHGVVDGPTRGRSDRTAVRRGRWLPHPTLLPARTGRASARHAAPTLP